MNREEDIRYFLEAGDRVWPPSIRSERSFIDPFVEVLERLPSDVYEVVSEEVWFIVENLRSMGENVPFTRTYPPIPGGVTVRFNTIVIFHQALTLPGNALIGLLAHEIAHGFVEPQDPKMHEQAADDLVKQWGFGEELEALEVERKKIGRKLSSGKE